jgi:hypothetical protein
VLIRKADQPASDFAGGDPVAPNGSGQIPITGDIIDSRRPLAKKSRQNLFADGKRRKPRSS